MPFPDLSDVTDGQLAGEGLVFGNLAHTRAELAAAGQGDPLADLQPAPTGAFGWPEGLAPTSTPVAAEGMPAHLTQPGTTFVPSPEDRDPSDIALGVVNNLATGPVNTVQITDADLLDMALSAAAPPASASASAAPDPNPASPAAPAMPGEGAAILYQQLGPALRLGVEDDNGLIWKIVCKTGTLALSPGPGATDIEKPLELTSTLFDDMLLSFEEKAMPYITVPETHLNGPLENTGYVQAAEKLNKQTALSDPRVNASARAAIKDDPDDTEYLLAGINFTDSKAKEKAKEGSIPDTSIGVKFGYRNKRTGKTYNAWEHVALTPVPWVDGLGAFGLSQDSGVFDWEAQPEHVDVYTDLDLAGKPDFLKGKDGGDGGDDKAAKGMKKVCPKCKTQNKADALKCVKCGTPLIGIKAQALSVYDANTDPDRMTGLLLGMRIDVHGSDWRDTNIDTGKLDAALQILSNGDCLDLPYGVGVQRVNTDGEDFWLVRGGYTGGSDDAPQILRDQTKVSTALQAKLQAAKVRSDEERKKYAQPIAADYSAKPDKLGGVPPSEPDDEPNNPPSVPDEDKTDYDALAATLEQEGAGGPLSEPDEPGTIHTSASSEGTQHMADQPTTVEELLAQHQVELEAERAQRIALESQLQASARTTSNLDRTIRQTENRDKIKKLQAEGVPAAILLAASAIYGADDTPRGEDGDLNLSVTVPQAKADGSVEQVEQTFTTPTQIVDFLLAAVPRVTQDEAAKMAALQAGLPMLSLSAHEKPDDEEERRQAGAAAAAARHPDLYNPDGTLKSTAA